MKFIIIPIGVLLFFAGASFIYDAEVLYNFLDDNIEKKSFYYAAILGRLIFGILLFKSAVESKYSLVIRIFGFLGVASAIIFLLIGHPGFQKMLATVIPYYKDYDFLIGVIIMGVGGFLAHTFWEEAPVKN